MTLAHIIAVRVRTSLPNIQTLYRNSLLSCSTVIGSMSVQITPESPYFKDIFCKLINYLNYYTQVFLVNMSCLIPYINFKIHTAIIFNIILFYNVYLIIFIYSCRSMVQTKRPISVKSKFNSWQEYHLCFLSLMVKQLTCNHQILVQFQQEAPFIKRII